MLVFKEIQIFWKNTYDKRKNCDVSGRVYVYAWDSEKHVLAINLPGKNCSLYYTYNKYRKAFEQTYITY